VTGGGRRLLRHRTVVFLIVVGLLAGGWEAFVRLSAPRRIDPDLGQALAADGLVNIAVTLGFPPEDFHIRLFQGYGVVSGVRGTTVLMNRVAADDVHRLARHYWIRKIAAQ
jgi:hypothetical protein